MRNITWILVLTMGCAPVSDSSDGAGSSSALHSDSAAHADAAGDDMIRVTGRSFLMGTDSSEVDGILDRYGLTREEIIAPELDQHTVQVDDFLLDARSVTNREFAEFVEARPEWSRARADSALHNGRYLEHWGPDGPAANDMERPVTFVTWYAAAAFCAWKDKRLPTEAEWELAAGDGDPAREFPWGAALPSDEIVSWSGGGHSLPMPVASYPPTGAGFYDLSGNVWEYLADPWLGSHAEAAQHGSVIDAAPDGDTLRIRRVVRGGSYEASVVNLRVRYRDSHRPFDAREMVGFRCARSIR